MSDNIKECYKYHESLSDNIKGCAKYLESLINQPHLKQYPVEYIIHKQDRLGITLKYKDKQYSRYIKNMNLAGSTVMILYIDFFNRFLNIIYKNCEEEIKQKNIDILMRRNDYWYENE